MHADPVEQNDVAFFLIYGDLNRQTHTLETLKLPDRINTPESTVSISDPLEHPADRIEIKSPAHNMVWEIEDVFQKETEKETINKQPKSRTGIRTFMNGEDHSTAGLLISVSKIDTDTNANSIFSIDLVS